MKYFICFCLINLSICIHAQSTATFHIQKDSGVFATVDTMPKFNGNSTLFLQKNLQYPQLERDAGVSGTVYVGFIIEANGIMDSIRILRGIDPGLDSAALKAVRSLPKRWTPGILNGKPVRVNEGIPINFQLPK